MLCFEGLQLKDPYGPRNGGMPLKSAPSFACEVDHRFACSRESVRAFGLVLP
jgi:hypothetical protein